MQACLLKDLARRMSGSLAQGRPDLRIARLHTDTRTIRAGDCFVALRGETFDGHNFLPQLPGSGAVAAVVDQRGELPAEFGLVEVADTLQALQDFSADYRRVLGLKVIGVTGSSGKTSTKEMIFSVLRQRFRTRATQGNLNNHIGVPLTLLDLEPGDECAVVEMGMNHAGEIAPLAAIAQPNIGVITNIGLAHIEHLGSREAIMREKGALLAALSSEGRAVLNADDDMVPALTAMTSARVVTAGLSPEADWRATHLQTNARGVHFRLEHAGEAVEVQLPLFSRVFVSNAVLAAAVGGESGLSLQEIKAGLEATELPGYRMKVLAKEKGWIINDAYNANPDSMQAALQALVEFPAEGRRIAVLGSMGELGAFAAEQHRVVGAAAAALSLDYYLFLGPHADDFEAGARSSRGDISRIVRLENAAAAVEWLQRHGRSNDCLLIKGSRFMKLEQIVEALLAKGSAR